MMTRHLPFLPPNILFLRTNRPATHIQAAHNQRKYYTICRHNLVNLSKINLEDMSILQGAFRRHLKQEREGEQRET